MLFLNVPYAEKDQAKALGARWDAGSKRWYVEDGALATPFERWIVAAGAADAILGDDCKPIELPRSATREKVAPRAVKQAVERVDSSAGKITVGTNYKEVVGATGLPW